MTLTQDWTSQDRKDHPVFTGVLQYFPDALLAVAELSKIANDKHNPGEKLHWSRGKSDDHGDALVRHQLDAGKWDILEGKKVRHSAEVAWRALAQLQLEIEADGQQAKDDGYTVDIFKTKQVSIEPRPNYDEPPFDGQYSVQSIQAVDPYPNWISLPDCECEICEEARAFGH